MPLWKRKDGEVNIIDKKREKEGDEDGCGTFICVLCWLCGCACVSVEGLVGVSFSSGIKAPVEGSAWDGGHTHSLVGACFCLVARLQLLLKQ